LAEQRHCEIINSLKYVGGGGGAQSDRAQGEHEPTHSIIRIVLREKITQDHSSRVPFPTRGRQERSIERFGRLGYAVVSSNSRKVCFGTVKLSRLQVHTSKRSAQFGGARGWFLCDERLK
jgi:hypothetical protein